MTTKTKVARRNPTQRRKQVRGATSRAAGERSGGKGLPRLCSAPYFRPSPSVSAGISRRHPGLGGVTVIVAA